MKVLFTRYLLGLLIGLVFGLMYPTLLPNWSLSVIFIGIFVVTEIFGSLGFGHRWHDYRWSLYALHSATAISALFGIFIGSGKLGTFLITLGTLLSR